MKMDGPSVVAGGAARGNESLGSHDERPTTFCHRWKSRTRPTLISTSPGVAVRVPATSKAIEPDHPPPQCLRWPQGPSPSTPTPSAQGTCQSIAIEATTPGWSRDTWDRQLRATSTASETRLSGPGVQRQVRSPFLNIEPANRPRI